MFNYFYDKDHREAIGQALNTLNTLKWDERKHEQLWYDKEAILPLREVCKNFILALKNKYNVPDDLCKLILHYTLQALSPSPLYRSEKEAPAIYQGIIVGTDEVTMGRSSGQARASWQKRIVENLANNKAPGTPSK